MPTNYTPNYQLSQWERSDAVLMDDFNADNEKIDAALAKKAEASTVSSLMSSVNTLSWNVARRGNCGIQVSPYTGDGTTSRTFSFPSVPVFIIVVGPQSAAFLIGNSGTTISPSSYNSGGMSTYGISWNGSQLTLAHDDRTIMMNISEREYQMIAFFDRS